jgi:hypothetical protein
LDGFVNRFLDDDWLGWRVNLFLRSLEAIHLSINARPKRCVKLFGRHHSSQFFIR